MTALSSRYWKSQKKRNKQDEYNVTIYFPFSLRDFNRYKANVSHVAQTWEEKVDQMVTNANNKYGQVS